jgi:hypothetical protein
MLDFYRLASLTTHGNSVAAGEVHAYALKAAALLAHRPQLRSSFG